jgi:cytochrome c oxidase subunit 2
MNPTGAPLTFWPVEASATAAETDHLLLAFTAVTLLLTVPIFVAITWFAIRYREGKVANREHRQDRNYFIEISWMLIPFGLTLIFFAWGARMFDTQQHPPADAMQINAVGRQWMWKFQHPTGQAEINNLHVPLGEPVEINLISQDVIHSLYIPALRIQMEALPDRYTHLWFTANRAGTYHLYCAEYCGTDHSKMNGMIIIMQPADFQTWLGQAGSDDTLAAEGKTLFSAYGCSGCHLRGSDVRAPPLAGLYGSPVPMVVGGTIIADAAYIHDKIRDPDRHPIAGYKQVMPSFATLPEGEIAALVAYIKSIGPQTAAADSQAGEQTP